MATETENAATQNQKPKTAGGCGDAGMTTLFGATQISKADERVSALGCLEELNARLSYAELCFADDGRESARRCAAEFANVRQALSVLRMGVAEPRNLKHKITAEEVRALADRTDGMTLGLPAPAFTPGSTAAPTPDATVVSAAASTALSSMAPTPSASDASSRCEAAVRLELSRVAARHAERVFARMNRKYPVAPTNLAYLNRLSAYLARAVHLAAAERWGTGGGLSASSAAGAPAAPLSTATVAPRQSQDIVDEIVRRVTAEQQPLNLKKATALIEAIEAYAQSEGRAVVVAVCNAEGNPVAVHVMDGALLVSYDVAVKKAYTAVSVRMSTMELSRLVLPGQTFCGLQNVDKMITFGGGVPLVAGGRIVGGLGVSGGTGEQDHALCEYGLRVFEKL